MARRKRKETYFTLAGIYLLLVGITSLIGVSIGLSIYQLSTANVKRGIHVDWSGAPPEYQYLYVLLFPFYFLQRFFCMILNEIYAVAGPVDPSMTLPALSFIINYLPAVICMVAGVLLIRKR